MRVDWQQELEGYSLLQIRDALRKLPFTDTEFTAGFVAKNLAGRVPLITAKRLIIGLIESGLVEFADEGPDNSAPRFVLTDTGISLRAAHATRRFKRARAEKAVGKLLRTAEAINADPIFLHNVGSVAVYGSYITGTPDLGDIDVAVKLKARWAPQSGLGGNKTEREMMAEKFEAKHPPPPSFYEKGFWRFWPETYTMRLLRTDPGMKIIEQGELELIGCPYRQIYPDTVDVPAKPDWSFDRQEIVLKRAEKSHA